MWSSPNCGRICGQKYFPPQTGGFSPAQGGKYFACQVGWIVTLTEGVCKSFLREQGGNRYLAVNKENIKITDLITFRFVLIAMSIQK